MGFRQHSNEVMVEVLAVARQEMPADGEARAPTRSTKGDKSDERYGAFATVWLRQLLENKCPDHVTYTVVVL